LYSKSRRAQKKASKHQIKTISQNNQRRGQRHAKESANQSKNPTKPTYQLKTRKTIDTIQGGNTKTSKEQTGAYKLKRTQRQQKIINQKSCITKKLLIESKNRHCSRTQTIFRHGQQAAKQSIKENPYNCSSQFPQRGRGWNFHRIGGHHSCLGIHRTDPSAGEWTGNPFPSRWPFHLPVSISRKSSAAIHTEQRNQASRICNPKLVPEGI